MADHPLLYRAPMIRALIAGTKTQTRRLAKFVPMHEGINLSFSGFSAKVHYGRAVLMGRGALGCWTQKSRGLHVPRVGDRIWVRETWQHWNWDEDGVPLIRYAADNANRWCRPTEDWVDRINDTWATLSDPANYEIDGYARDRKWRPSIFMPRFASRLTQTITDVRVQRLQDISEEDAIAEGIRRNPVQLGTWIDYPEGSSGAGWACPRESYRTLWDSINAKRPGASWADNPWVVAISATTELRNIDDVSRVSQHAEAP